MCRRKPCFWGKAHKYAGGKEKRGLTGRFGVGGGVGIRPWGKKKKKGIQDPEIKKPIEKRYPSTDPCAKKKRLAKTPGKQAVKKKTGKPSSGKKSATWHQQAKEREGKVQGAGHARGVSWRKT